MSGGDVPALKAACLRSLKRTYEIFLSNVNASVPDNPDSHKAKVTAKIIGEYNHVKDMPNLQQQRRKPGQPPLKKQRLSEPEETSSLSEVSISDATEASSVSNVIADYELSGKRTTSTSTSTSLVAVSNTTTALDTVAPQNQTRLALAHYNKRPKPAWHAPWKLKYVISGHLGWVRCIAFEPGNEWFCTGAADRTIKLWDLASGQLKITLTGHVSTIRGLVVSNRHNYLFSCGEDKMVRCWDLEMNKAIRHYHGHLSGVYAIGMHPKLDVLVTGGRDSTARVWDIRTKAEVHVLKGHSNTVTCLGLQAADPQVVTGSEDSTVRLWDLGMGKQVTTLTNHKRGVRALQIHPTEFTFASASPDNIKKWRFPHGEFFSNFSGHNSIINALALNQDNVFVSGADNGSTTLWDWTTGYPFQRIDTIVQPGSLESEAGIFATQFDLSGSRLITGEADKTIKVYQEDMNATPETHPVDPLWKPVKDRNRF